MNRPRAAAHGITEPMERIATILEDGFTRRGRADAAGRAAAYRHRMASRPRPQRRPRPTLAASGLRPFAYLRRYGTPDERNRAAQIHNEAARHRATLAQVRASILGILEPDAVSQELAA